MVATLVARNENEAMVVPMIGSGGVCVWRESGARRSVLCWSVWQDSGFIRREDVFTFNLVEKKFNAICKDNAAINCITVQHRKVSFPSTLTGHTYIASMMINSGFGWKGSWLV
jgi:hypothetical protein